MAPLTTQEHLDNISVSNVNVDVPSLGSAEGFCYDGKTCQYLSIPYATVPGRFRRPQPAPSPWPENGHFDATKFRCVHCTCRTFDIQVLMYHCQTILPTATKRLLSYSRATNPTMGAKPTFNVVDRMSESQHQRPLSSRVRQGISRSSCHGLPPRWSVHLCCWVSGHV